jgi:hypothetical protein
MFNFVARDSYTIPETDVITVTVDASAGTLVVNPPASSSVSYPLIDADGNPIAQAIFVDASTSPQSFQVGDVTFAREGLFVNDIPLNSEGSVTITVARTGHLGVLDQRDFGKSRKVVYFFDMMPVILTIEGSSLRVKTLRHETDDDFGPWYIIYQIP